MGSFVNLFNQLLTEEIVTLSANINQSNETLESTKSKLIDMISKFSSNNKVIIRDRGMYNCKTALIAKNFVINYSTFPHRKFNKTLIHS